MPRRVTTVAINATVKQAAPYLKEHLPGARVRKHKDPSQRVIYVQHPRLDEHSFGALSGIAEHYGVPVVDIGERFEFDG